MDEKVTYICGTIKGWSEYYWILDCGHEILRYRRPNGREWKKIRICRLRHKKQTK